MKKRILSLLLLVFAIGLINSEVFGTAVKYDPKAALNYVETYCSETTYNTEKYECFNKSNPNCKSTGSDCANFMSQALINGGITFSDCINSKDSIYSVKGNGAKCGAKHLTQGNYTIGKDGAAKGVPYASDLELVLKESYCFKKVVDQSSAKEGDIVVLDKNTWGCANHVGMVTDKTNKYYAAHTADRCSGDKTCKDSSGKYIECKYDNEATVLQFQNQNKCKKCEQDEKTCKAELKQKCTDSVCFYCEESTGECKDRCAGNGVGRCASQYKCILTGMVFGGQADWFCCNMGPSGDCPDDTLTVGSSTSIDSEITHPSGTSPVGILKAGYSYDILKVLSTFGQSARIISPNDFDPSLVSEMPLFIIPTGGLMGLAESEILKTALNEYVKKGGTLIVFSQQYGYEFSALPVPEEADGTYKKVGGFGWLEDQSCQINSSYIDTWHQMLAGQTKSTPSINIDGYFTSYPENTQIIRMGRVYNTAPQPAIIIQS